jgi:uncharacterized protein YodC (DUF2158 family)
VALNFPNNPGIGSVFTDTTAGFSYEWDGTVWKSYSASSSSQIKIIDDISGSFTGVAKTFALASSGVSLTPPTAQSLLITLSGVVQEPIIDYTISTSNIVFVDAPSAGLAFGGISLGPALPITTIPNETSTEGSFNVVGVLSAANLKVAGVSTFVGFATHTGTIFGSHLSLTGVVTASSFVGNVTGTATGLSGSPSITVTGVNASGVSTFVGFATHTGTIFGSHLSLTGVVTASSFVGALTGNATGLSGSPSITVTGVNASGVVTASSFVGSGANLTNLNIPSSFVELDATLFG